MRKRETHAPRYDESGHRLTDCCGAFSTYMDGDVLCCKKCYWEVPVGQGDGTETRDDKPGHPRHANFRMTVRRHR